MGYRLILHFTLMKEHLSTTRSEKALHTTYKREKHIENKVLDTLYVTYSSTTKNA